MTTIISRLSFSTARSQEEYLRNPNDQRRAIGILAVFATLMTVVAIWDLPKTERNAVRPV